MPITDSKLFKNVTRPVDIPQSTAPVIQDDRIPMLIAQVQELHNRINTKRPDVIATIQRNNEGQMTHIILREIQ